MTLSPVSNLTSYSLSVMNRYSADIWLQLISSPCRMETDSRFQSGREAGARNIFFLPLTPLDNEAFSGIVSPGLRLTGRRRRKRASPSGSIRRFNTCARGRILRILNLQNGGYAATLYSIIGCHCFRRDHFFKSLPRSSLYYLSMFYVAQRIFNVTLIYITNEYSILGAGERILWFHVHAFSLCPSTLTVDE